MSFADEIRNQARSREELAEEEARRQKQLEEEYREVAIRDFESMEAALKKQISEKAQKGEFTQNSQYGKVIQGTVLLQCNFDGVPDGDRVKYIGGFLDHCVMEKNEVLQRRKRFLGKYEDLWRLSLKARFPWFGDVLRDAIAGLRQEGIDASFTLEWSIGRWNNSVDTQIYKIPLEQLAAGFQAEIWLDRSLYRSNSQSGVYLDTYNNEKALYCTYQFRF